MSWIFLRRTTIMSYHLQPKSHSLSLSIFHKSRCESTSSCYNQSFHHSSSFSKVSGQSNDYKIDIVDNETWQVSTGFADILKDTTTPSLVTNASHAQVVENLDNPDFDQIDDLRICGRLFYKLDRDSKEYEEYNFDFHRRKSSKKKGDSKDSIAKESPNSNEIIESKTKRNPVAEQFSKFDKMEGSFIEKKQRVPTFNQLTGPYHEPFCLDIYISKASVRACIVHRATSNVVVVAHSISKDMKFDLGSLRDAAACAAVGKVLAQRALADDIHNVVYTPRKGEKLEGKLQVVLQSVINNGVLVKVKIKKNNLRKSSFRSADYKRN